MDRQLRLFSASLVLMLISFDGRLARPWREQRDESVDREEKERTGFLRQALDMLQRILERFEESEERRKERTQPKTELENERILRERTERERTEKERTERERTEREQYKGPIESEEEAKQRKRKDDAHAFLEQFGYLSALPVNVSHDPDSTRSAICEMQRMYSLDVTGELDEDTLQMMNMPRCGMPDAIPKEHFDVSRTRSGENLNNQFEAQNFELSGTKWSKQVLKWYLRNYTSLLSPEVTKNVIRQAFKFWSDVSSLTFVESETEGDINMEFARGLHEDGPAYAFDGPGNVVAHAFYPEIGEAHFDDEEYWTDGEAVGINFMSVATHELGHTVGLSHSNVSGSVMAAYYIGYDPRVKYQLGDDDIQAIQSLYGGPKARTTTSASSKTAAPTLSRILTQTPAILPPSCGQPNACDVIYKAIMQTQDHRIYIFNGQWMWRTNDHGLEQGFPLTISTYYENPPEDITAAIFSWKTYYTYMFKGKTVWRYYGVKLIESKTIDKPGYPDNPESAIASRDNNILLIKGGKVWQFDEELLGVKDMCKPIPFDSLFPGAPATFDSAVRLVNDSHIYFFNGPSYYKYSEDARLIVEGYPKEKAGPWMGQACGAKPNMPK